jgi:hypothetical protein
VGPSFRILFLIELLLSPATLHSQEERQPSPPGQGAYDSKFFAQLHNIFGIFRDADLQRVFQMAKPIQCSELVVSKGEWRTVAFYNEDRSLGDWCRNNLEEVKSDLSVYIFTGSCKGERGAVQVTTKFPVGSSIEAYDGGLIPLDQVAVNVNAPVNAYFNSRNQTYEWELPYLYLSGRRNSGNIYSLIPPTRDDKYAPEVTQHWECKAVKSNDVTYRFLICRTAMVARNVTLRNMEREPGFGASAYFILSDGMEAQTSVSLSFGDAGNLAATPQPNPSPASVSPPAAPTAADSANSVGGWEVPALRSKIMDVGKNEFRIRFNPKAWTGKIGSVQVLTDQKLSSRQTVRLRDGADYCAWRPENAGAADRLLAVEPDEDILYYVEGTDRNFQFPVMIVFDMRTHSGLELGTLKCFFLRNKSATSVEFDRWVSAVGDHLTLEIRR